MANYKKKSLAAQLATQGPTKGQQRIGRRVQLYDELMRKQQPLTKKDAESMRKTPPTKRERKITRALQRQARLVRKEWRQANRSNIAALLNVTRSSRPTELTETDHLQFCGNITIQSKDEAIQNAIEASATSFDPYHRILFTSAKGGKRNQTTGMRSAGAGVVCKMASGNMDHNSNADHIWEKKSFSLGPSQINSTTQNIEAGLRSVAEALALVATQLACASDDGMQQIDNLSIRPKVTIFTDSQAVMNKVSNIELTALQLESMPSLEKLITRSEYLRHLGVEVELRWSPRLQSEGSKQAEGASRRAATSHGACKSGDSLDDGLQILIDSLEQQ
ncbi:hypothetical protein F5883DRAFT_666319 [Diaporthe sp. PMI_573]|nr:hypothetical protein F5883DRAFT_666319 [Diaporthaceae sp. PMI_573]